MNLTALQEFFVRFSSRVVEQSWISEIDINPLLASPERLLALDARVALHPLDTPRERLARPAIRPYPAQYIAPWTMKDGTPVIIRPIRPEDEPLLVRLHETLSEESVHHRYFSQLQLGQRIAHERLIRMCFNDYDREIALVVEHRNPDGGEPAILGVGRLSKLRGLNEAVFTLIISDTFQRKGLGTELLGRLVKIGRDEGLERVTATMLAENCGMRQLAESVGFKLVQDPGGQVFNAELPL